METATKEQLEAFYEAYGLLDTARSLFQATQLPMLQPIIDQLADMQDDLDHLHSLLPKQ